MQKRIWRKTLSMILVLTLLVSVIPLQVYAIAGDALASTITDDAVVSPQEPLATQRVVEEDESRRSEFSKEFVLNNGLRLATIYPSAVHYEDDGIWKDIDNTLIAAISDGESVYTNTAGKWSIFFPQSLSHNNMIGIAMNGFTVQFGMAGELRSTGDVVVASVGQIGGGEMGTLAVSTAQTSVAQIQQVDLSMARAAAEYPETVLEKMYSRLTYPNIYPNTNIVYDLQGNKLKESVIMQHYDADLWGYRYTLDTGDLIPILNENQQIDLCDPNTNEVVLTMPAPYLVDSNGEYNDDVQVSLTRSGSMYLLSYYLPVDWLADAARAWPVILDPVVSASCASTNILDHTVSETQEDHYHNTTIECGYSTKTGVNRTYLKYVNLPKLTSADVIVEAKISMLKLSPFNHSNIVEVHKVKEAWEVSTITWGNKPDYVTTIEDYVVCLNAGRYEWNITDIVRDWYAKANTGMLFKAPDATENSTQSWQQFASSDFSADPREAPVLEIVFRNANGLESYWDYTAHSAGRAGVGYVNNYNGNLVWIHNDIGFGGNRMPVSISHVYNANDSNDNDSNDNEFGMGNGWRINYNQRVYVWTQDANYYIWEDSDGTLHYFYKASNDKYVDEDGLYLTLTTTGTGDETYQIKDQYGNISYFNTDGHLVKIINNQQTPSNIAITYENGLIKTIRDGAGRIYVFTYTDGLLSRISYNGTDGTTEISYVSYSYNEDGCLAGITYEDGKTVTYTYNERNLLTSAQDIDGYKLQYDYNLIPTTSSYQPSRVATITEYDVRNIEDPDDDKMGGQLSIEYATNQTTFTDHNGNIQIVQFNNWGNPVAVMDGEGRGQFATYNEPETKTEKGNQLKLSSKLQNTVGNMMVDSGFERAWLWTATSDDINQEISTEEAYYGSKSLKMTRSVAGAAAGVFEPSFAALPGKSYTFSAYVKTSEGAEAYLQIVDNVQVTVTSETLPGNSDWTRLEVTYTNKTSANRTMRVRLMTETAGTVYMDCVQLEKAPTASRYNLIDNGDFGALINWTASSGAGTNIQRVIKPEPEAGKTILELDQLDNYAYQFIGNPQGQLYLKQDVLVSGNANDTFVLAGWAQGDSVPLKDDRKFCLRGVFTYTDGSTSEDFEFSFNPDADSNVNWQYAAGMMRAEKAYTKITVYVVYDYNANAVLFDGIQLYKEEFGTELTYNEHGDVTEVEDIQGQKTEYTYDPETHDLTKITLPDGTETTYTYDAYHNVLTSTSYTGVVTSYTYDAWGNNLTVSVGSGTNKITSSAAYSADGNRLVSTTDTAGKVTQYSYHQDTNVLEWVQYPEDTAATRTAYTYDEMYRLTSTQVTTDQNSTLTASYTYADDLLTGLTTASTTYSFTYGDFSLRSRVAIGSRTLAQYTYSEQNNFLERLDYGNGDRVQYEYDKQGRVTRQTYENGDTVTYRYDNNGALASVTDSATGRTTTYYYDFTNRLMKYVETGDVSHSVQYTYDDQNKLTDLVEVINGVTQTTHYTYDDDQRIRSIQNGNKVISYTYDDYGRVSQKTDGIFTYVYAYKNTDAGMPTWQVATVTVLRNGSTIATFGYGYDDNGNILSAYDSGLANTYVYDSAGQLIRENNKQANKTWVWTYDDAGNILSKREYAYTTGNLGTVKDTIVYTYGDSDWGDLLTAYDGVSITYDQMGNPLNDGTWTYTWEHGRQLAAMSNGGTTWTYTYDANGMRSSRSNGGTTYSYVYNGSKLMQMTVGGYKLTFTYDGSGNPSTVTLNGTTYYYITNLQGDVIQIRTGSGALVCDYSYDAWGNVVYTSNYLNNTLRILNPLLYRGYVYDRDTGLYYLQSRYYNPAIGRFINADALVSTGQGVLGNNMFAYCLNNPVAYSDSQGTDARTCLSADGAIDDAPWRDHSPSGGGVIYNYKTKDPDYSGDKFLTQIALRYVKIGLGYAWEGVKDGATWLWDAYMRGYNLQQEVQMQQAAMNCYTMKLVATDEVIWVIDSIAYSFDAAAYNYSGDDVRVKHGLGGMALLFHGISLLLRAFQE